MVSCLAKRVKYQLLQGETILEHVACLDSLDSLYMFICCTGIRLLVEEQKMAGTVLADLIIPEIRLSVTTAVSSGENFYLPICRSLHLLALSFRDVELDNIWPTPFRN